MDIENISPKVRTIIADVLLLDEVDIQRDSRLIADLGAESIDFLDLVFQLEKTFQVKIPRGQIERQARGVLSEEEFSQKGELTPAGLQALKHYLSEVPETSFPAHMKVVEIPTLFTVETFCKLVAAASQLQSVPETVA